MDNHPYRSGTGTPPPSLWRGRAQRLRRLTVWPLTVVVLFLIVLLLTFMFITSWIVWIPDTAWRYVMYDEPAKPYVGGNTWAGSSNWFSSFRPVALLLDLGDWLLESRYRR